MGFKRYFTFILILVLAGCFAGRKNKDRGSNTEGQHAFSRSGEFDWNGFEEREKTSSFIIMDFRAEINTRKKLYSKGTQDNRAVIVYFSAMLRDRATMEILVEHRFQVLDYHGKVIDNVVVQDDNRISWTETIRVDNLRPQVDPVLVVRRIKAVGQGASVGYNHAVFELNPWAYLDRGIGEPFLNLTNRFEILKDEHKDFKPDFDPNEFFANPEGTEFPSLNIDVARFYLSREEKITNSISSVEPIKMYNTSGLENRRENLNKNKNNYKNAFLIGRGVLIDEQEPSYMRRDHIISTEEKVKKPVLGMKLRLNVNLRLKTEVTNSAGKIIYRDINHGRFRVFAALVASNLGINNEEEKDVLIGIASPVVGDVKNQILNVKFDMVTSKLSNRGDLDLVLKVRPLDEWSARGLKPSSIIYKLGAYNDSHGHKGGFVDSRAVGDFEYDDYVRKVKKFTEKHEKLLSEWGILTNLPDIIFDSMEIKFRTVKTGETATQRTVIFDVKSCPRDGHTGKRFRQGRKFRILVSGIDPLKCDPEEYKDKGEEDSECRFKRVPVEDISKQDEDNVNGIFKVQDTGCLSWVDEIAHKYYQRENLIERSYHIVEDVEDIGSVEEQRDIFKLTGYFNPWDEKFGTLGVDARNLSDSFIKEIKERVKYPSRFFVGDFSYMTLRFRYDIDENMHLTVKKTVLLNLYPFVKRYSNIINGINGNFPIRDGIYLLKVAYQKDYIDPGAEGIHLKSSNNNQFETEIVVKNGTKGSDRNRDFFMLDDLRRKTFVHTIKKLVRVENSRVISPVEFHINELRTLRVRSNLLLQLEPVNQYKLQIINLLENRIARNIGLRIGDLGRFKCFTPGVLEEILKLLQKTIDEIALSIPDNVNYTSKESFKKMIDSNSVREPLNNLAKHRLLKDEKEKFELTSEYIKKLEKEFSSNKSSEQSTKSSKQSTEGLETLVDELRKLNKVPFPDRESNNTDLYSYEDFLIPSPSDDSLKLKEEDRNEKGLPSRALGDDDAEEVSNIAKKVNSFLGEVTSLDNLQKLLNNDFTIDPAISRVSDLDYLIDRKAGIIRRTFIGPLTLLPLDNKNIMNATDALDYDESSNDDGQNQNFNKSFRDDINRDYERNPKFGYQGHFKNCHVDDFIVNDQHEELIYDAWAECVKRRGIKKENEGGKIEIKIPDDFICDYEKTVVYKNYLLKDHHPEKGDHHPEKETNEVLNKAYEYSNNSSPFKKFARHKNEKMLKNEGRCFYRDIWFKKYFSQKMVQKAQAQFGNFLSSPSVTAKVVQPINDEENALKISAVKEECLEGGKINKGCIEATERFDLSVSKFSDSLLGKDKSVGDYFINPRRRAFDDTPYKSALINFYGKYDKSELTKLRKLDDGDERRTASEKLSKAIYETLFHIAAPTVKVRNKTNYKAKLEQIAPNDFGRDVQGFLCNIMLPRADQTYHEFLEEYKNLNPQNEEDAKELKKTKERGFDPDGDILNGINGITSLFNPHYNGFKRALNECHRRAGSANVEKVLPFQLERKFKTLKIGRYFFRGGKSINFAISQGVAISHNLNVSNKYTLDPTNSIKDVLKNIPATRTVLAYLSSLMGGAIKFHEYTQNENNGTSDSATLATNAYLSMQAAELDLELLEYRRCMLVRWNEDFLSDVLPDDIKIFKEVIPKKNNIFICGNKEDDPIAIRENYYYITQHFTEGDLLDTANLLNNPWLLILRGYRDMIAFVRALYPSSKFSNEENPPNVIKLIMDDFERLTTPGRPIFVPASLKATNERGTSSQQLEPWLIMSKAYRNVTPSFPGLFTQLSNKEASLPIWPWEHETQLEKKETKKEYCEKHDL